MTILKTAEFTCRSCPTHRTT